MFDADHYPVFHRYADLSYRQLDHIFRLPYPDAAFDAVIASGVLEHVPMGYESLKELHRVLRPDGRLIITYLPNRGLGGRMVAPARVPRLPPASVQQIRVAAPSTSHRVPPPHRRLPNPVGPAARLVEDGIIAAAWPLSLCFVPLRGRSP